MEIGIIGLPYSGKSTIFSTLLRHKSDSQPGKMSAERGIVKVPDSRLDKLTEIIQPKKQVNTTIEFIKVPGLDKDSNAAQGLPGAFLTSLKNVAALLVVIRHFETDFYPHPFGRIDAAADMAWINSEFLISDLIFVETRIEKLQKSIPKTQSEKEKRELHMMLRFKKQLDQELPIRQMDLNEDELAITKGYQFLTIKPILFVINIRENQIPLSSAIEDELQPFVGRNCAITTLSAEIEKEIAELSPDDAAAFMADLGIKEPAVHKLIRKSYELLNLISFFTVGDKECRAWTVRKNSTARQAAGAIHSDMEKGFIRAETVAYDDLVLHKSLNACKEKGVLRLEGKDYPVKDGDVLTIRFNV
jgi:ribosome-binding ATPase